MVDFTPRLGLAKLEALGTEDPSDYPPLQRLTMDALDAAAGFLICTSSTRPVSPYNGQVIRETDTGNTYVRQAGVWAPVGVINCTSSTRPASPAIGQVIQETDTGRAWIYDSVISDWRLLAGPSPAGRIRSASLGAIGNAETVVNNFATIGIFDTNFFTLVDASTFRLNKAGMYSMRMVSNAYSGAETSLRLRVSLAGVDDSQGIGLISGVDDVLAIPLVKVKASGTDMYEHRTHVHWPVFRVNANTNMQIALQSVYAGIYANSTLLDIMVRKLS